MTDGYGPGNGNWRHRATTTQTYTSGVARLGHTGARALATRGRAPPVRVCNQIISADCIVVDRKSGATLTVRESYTPPRYSLKNRL